MKHLLLIFALIGISQATIAQTKEELKKLQTEKKDSIDALQKQVDAIQEQIDAIPGWRFGAFGTIGGSISGFNNWYAKEAPNSSAGNFGFNINANADLIQDNFFWKNSTNINISWVKFDDEDDPTDSDEYGVATDVFTLTSLYGHKLTEKLAVSALGEYRSTLVNNFNNPGFLDIGTGITWTPLDDLIVVVHPLNYNFVFSDGDTDYNSSLGAKIVADYTKKFGDFNIKTNLSVFQSYASANYSNWTWNNSFSYSFWKNIGVGFDFGLRQNKQEALNWAQNTDPDATFDDIDNELQSYWLFGLNIKLE